MATITVSIQQGNNTLNSHRLATENTEALRIQAQKNVNYLLTDESTGFAPENLTATRHGKDLHIAFEGSQEADLIIENYYEDGNNNLLIGLHENGQYYAYIPESANSLDIVTQLAEQVSAGQALGGEALSAAVFNPAWLIAPLALAGIAAAISGGNNDNDDSTASNPAAPSVTTDSKTGNVFVIPDPKDASVAKTVTTFYKEDGDSTKKSTVEVTITAEKQGVRWVITGISPNAGIIQTSGSDPVEPSNIKGKGVVNIDPKTGKISIAGSLIDSNQASNGVPSGSVTAIVVDNAGKSSEGSSQSPDSPEPKITYAAADNSLTVNNLTQPPVDATSSEVSIEGGSSGFRLAFGWSGRAWLPKGSQTEALVTNGKVEINTDGTISIQNGVFTPGETVTASETVPGLGTGTATVQAGVLPPNIQTASPTDVEATNADTDGNGTDDETIVTGKAPAGSTVTVTPQGGQPVTVTAKPDCSFTATLPAQPTDTPISVVAKEDGKEASDPADTVAPELDDTPNDITPPTIAPQTFAYDENQKTNAVLGKVEATDPESAITGYAITSGNDNGWFAIDAEGNITLTTAGLTSAANDFEIGLNSFMLGVTATSQGGTSQAATITLNVGDVIVGTPRILLSEDTGVTELDFISKKGDVVIKGIDGANIEYRINGEQWKSYSNGFTLPNNDSLVEGVEYTVETRQTLDGEVSAVASQKITVDTKTQVSVTGVEKGKNSFVLIGKGEIGAKVSYKTATAIVENDGTFRLTVNETLPVGATTIKITAVDKAGNTATSDREVRIQSLSNVLNRKGSEVTAHASNSTDDIIVVGQNGGYGDISSSVLTNTVNTGAGNDSITLYGAITQLTGTININMGAGDDIIRTRAYMRAGNKNNNVLDMGEGNDTVILGDPTLTGSSGTGTAGRILDGGTVKLGNGDNTFIARGHVYNGVLESGSGDDTYIVYGNIANTTINAGTGNDSLKVTDGTIKLSQIIGFEHFDITEGKVTIDEVTVANLAKGDVKEMTVDGDSSDRINIGTTTTNRVGNLVDNSQGSAGSWVKGAQVVENGNTYDVYTNSGYTLKIDSDIVIY